MASNICQALGDGGGLNRSRSSGGSGSHSTRSDDGGRRPSTDGGAASPDIDSALLIEEGHSKMLCQC